MKDPSSTIGQVVVEFFIYNKNQIRSKKMIEFIKRYFTTPTYKLTPMDSLFMSLIVIGLILVLCLIAWGISCLIIIIKEKNKGKKHKGDNYNG